MDGDGSGARWAKYCSIRGGEDSLLICNTVCLTEGTNFLYFSLSSYRGANELDYFTRVLLFYSVKLNSMQFKVNSTGSEFCASRVSISLMSKATANLVIRNKIYRDTYMCVPQGMCGRN